MDYWKKRKLRNIIIIAVLVLAALWGVRMLLRPHARMVTVKYVEDEATLHSVRNSGGYTRAVSTDDKDFFQRAGELMEKTEALRSR